MRGLILAVFVLLVVAACGDGGGPDSTPTPSATPSPTATVTPKPTATAAAMPEATPTATARPTGAEEPIRYARGVYTIASDGSGLTLLARLPFWPMRTRSYSLSPSGRFLAFVDGEYPTETVYLMGVGGQEDPRALATFQSVWDLAVSPDDGQIMVHGRLNDAKGLYLVATQDGRVAPLGTAFESVRGLSWSPDGGQLAFLGMAERDAAWGIYIVNSDGSGLRALASGYGALAWSPDGSRIAYTVFRGDGDGVFLLDREGNVTRLSDARPGSSTRLAWAPDGGRIAFVEAGEAEEASRIAVIDVESGEQVTLTRGTDPAWSPHGSHVAVIRDGDLYLINADGSQETRLTNASQPYVAEPSWLPDGSGLVFSFMPPVMGSIYLINPDGSEEIWLADGHGPEWSPDGEMIAFVGGGTGGGLGGRSDIYVMDSEGGSAVKVGEYNWNDLPPMCPMAMSWSWSLDGQLILYSDMVAGDVIVARSDGGGTRKIADGYSPAWSPDGQRFVYSAYGDGAGCQIHLSDLQGIDEADWIAKGTYPIWSPDGQRIAFIRLEPGAAGAGAVYVINVDGSGERKLLDISRYSNLLPLAWSPDASRLAVAADGLFVVDLATGESQKLSDKALLPAWSPDSTKIAFVVDPGPGQGSDSIYIVDADGSDEPQRLTRGEYPAWSPDGSRIAFTR